MAKISDNSRGALLMIASMTAFTLNDACMKALSGDLPLFQALALRSFATTLCLCFLAYRAGALSYPVARPDKWRIALRTLSEIGAAYFFVSALFNMPIANVSAILQVLPLSVTLAGAVFLGEAVGWRRLGAILVGFAGVILIVRPGSEGFNIFSLYAVGAVASVTVRDLVTRRMSFALPSLTVALWSSVGVALFSAAGAAGVDWAPVSPVAAAQLAGSTLFIIGGYLFSVMVMRVGDIAYVAPFRYSSLIVALIVGLVIFGEWPDPLTLLGSSIVVATGIFAFYREQRIRRRAEQPDEAG